MADNKDGLRVFIAFRLNEEARREIYSVSLRLAPHFNFGRIKWVAPEHMHITALFVGKINTLQEKTVSEIIQNRIPDTRAFQVTIEGMGIFGRPPRILWAGSRDSNGIMTHINRTLSAELCKESLLKPDGQEYRPHITIGRIRSSADPKKIEDLLNTATVDFKTTIDSLDAVRSRLTQHGPEYEIFDTRHFS